MWLIKKLQAAECGNIMWLFATRKLDNLGKGAKIQTDKNCDFDFKCNKRETSGLLRLFVGLNNLSQKILIK